ncbi:MAG TPA: AAA family ATPase [Bryobacteraceae bacterium]|nr:AAA family ATPase [Bryobacteraceae bacterium]
MYPISLGMIVETKELWEDLTQALQGIPVRISMELSEIPSDWPAFLDRMDRIRPDVVLLEVTRLTGRLEEIVKKIRSTKAEPAVFAIQQTADSDAILGALRAGASEFLFPPMAEPLKAALERQSQSRQQMREKSMRSGKALGFVSAKGGCGATTVACHVASALARLGTSRVLLADLDLQAGMVGFLMKAKSQYSMADAAANLQRLDHSYWQGLISNGIPNLEVITAPTAPAAKQLPPAHLRQVLAFARTQYDWTVLDLGRNVNPTTLALLDGIDQTFLVTTQEVPALHQAKQIIQILFDAGYGRSQFHLVLNRVTRRFDVTIEELESMLGVPVYATLSNDYNALHDAFSEGRLLDGPSALADDFERLAARIGGVPEPTSKKRKFSLFG